MNSEAVIGLANYEIVRIEHSGGAVRIRNFIFVYFAYFPSRTLPLVKTIPKMVQK